MPTSTPNSDIPIDFKGELGGIVFFPFDINLAINPDLEITLSNLEDEVFSLERSIMDFQQAGLSQHNQYGSGVMSSQLVDDFGHQVTVIIKHICI